MPSLHYLNPPPNPFWDFVAGIEDHPMFAAYAHPPGYTAGENANPEAGPAQASQQEQPAAEMSEKARGKQASAEDPPEVDPSTINEKKSERREGGRDMPFRGRGRFGSAFEDGPDGPRRGHGCRGRGGFEGRGGRGGHPHPHHGGPPSFGFGPPGSWWARRGPPPPGWPHEGHHGPGPRHGGPHHRRGSPGHEGREGFNLGEFLNNLGQRLGVDISGAAEGLGLDRFTGPRKEDADFEPRADVFDTPAAYIIHLSAPGAKKSDVGVDWDGEHSILRIAGVVHRPGADEALLAHLVVDGRKRETGVFEKSIRLGTKRDPASVDVAGINAKMTDGVLVVTVPKVEREHKTREVPITAGSSPARNENENENEKQESLLDAPEIEMYDAAPTQAAPAKAKEAEVEAEVEAEKQGRDDRSETMDYEHGEKLPEYEAEPKETHEESDWEKDGSEDEGEYVKINVD